MCIEMMKSSDTGDRSGGAQTIRSFREKRAEEPVAPTASSSNERIGKEEFGSEVGLRGSRAVRHPMGYARSPNKTPEPTRLRALRFRMWDVRSTARCESKHTAGA